MTCSKCGKYLGYNTAVLKGKDICKRCKEAALRGARLEEGLLLKGETGSPKKETQVTIYLG
ncbi:MAG: hypothetical protein ABID84_03970 [Chloroflexota bacterium]